MRVAKTQLQSSSTMVIDCFGSVTSGPCGRSQVFTSSMRWPRELLQTGRHRRVCLLAALLASAPDALVRADARAPALLAFAPFALVLADARPPRTPCVCSSWCWQMLAPPHSLHVPPALLASAPSALVLADAAPRCGGPGTLGTGVELFGS